MDFNPLQLLCDPDSVIGIKQENIQIIETTGLLAKCKAYVHVVVFVSLSPAQSEGICSLTAHISLPLYLFAVISSDNFKSTSFSY